MAEPRHEKFARWSVRFERFARFFHFLHLYDLAASFAEASDCLYHDSLAVRPTHEDPADCEGCNVDCEAAGCKDPNTLASLDLSDLPAVSGETLTVTYAVDEDPVDGHLFLTTVPTPKATAKKPSKKKSAKKPSKKKSAKKAEKSR